MDRLVTALEIIAGIKRLTPGLGLLGSVKTPEGKMLAFPIDPDDIKFQSALAVIASWEPARPVKDHRPGF